jgi:hypothetical protein
MRKSKFILLSLILWACQTQVEDSIEESESVERIFQLISAQSSGINFSNDIKENDTVNVLDYEYSYNGGGIGVGYFNRDSLPDLFFSGNQVGNKLYLNQGGLTFKDATAGSGLDQSMGWASGVSVVDLNQDGLDDLYICYTGSKVARQRANEFFLNNGDGTFTEQAVALGIADTSYSTQAVFFDYDKDLDLDLFVINHANDFQQDDRIDPVRADGSARSTDRLFRNDGTLFTDVSQESGILYENRWHG